MFVKDKTPSVAFVYLTLTLLYPSNLYGHFIIQDSENKALLYLKNKQTKTVKSSVQIYTGCVFSAEPHWTYFQQQNLWIIFLKSNIKYVINI